MRGIRKIAPYVPGEQPNFSDMIKLNTNENAYPPSPKVQQALMAFEANNLKLYSSLTNQSLKQALAEQHHLTPEHFIIGNGSDEILAFAMLAFFNSDQPVLFPDITYGFYKVWGELFHIPFSEIPLKEDFSIDLQDYQQANGGIVLANPNAPTGLYISPEKLCQLLDRNQDTVVIIDEAYIDFGGESMITYLNNYANLIITRTLSKSCSLAGLRVGYAIGNPELIGVMEAIKSSFNPYSVDSIAESLATAAIKDAPYYRQINQEICQTRDWFSTELENLGFSVLPSLTNFVLLSHSTLNISELFDVLAQQHIFVRYFSKPKRLDNFLRISIGTKTEMTKLLAAIKNFL